MRIMMSAAGSAVAPGIIRHLQSLGHYVIGSDCRPYGSASDEFHQSPLATDIGYLIYLARFVGRADLYIPFLDEELKRFANTKPRGLQIVCSGDTTLRIFTSKIRQHDEMEHARLPVIELGLREEMIAKPDCGRGGRGHVRTHIPEIIDHLRGEGWYAEDFVNGDEYTVDALTGLDGAFLFAVPRLRIQTNGVSVIGKIVMDEEIIDLARQVVSKFDFRGPINIQVIRERNTVKLFIIEVNPRLSGSCMFTVMAGFDILDATIKLFEGKPFVPPEKIDDGLIIRRHYVEERL